MAWAGEKSALVVNQTDGRGQIISEALIITPLHSQKLFSESWEFILYSNWQSNDYIENFEKESCKSK